MEQEPEYEPWTPWLTMLGFSLQEKSYGVEEGLYNRKSRILTRLWKAKGQKIKPFGRSWSVSLRVPVFRGTTGNRNSFDSLSRGIWKARTMSSKNP